MRKTNELDQQFQLSDSGESRRVAMRDQLQQSMTRHHQKRGQRRRIVASLFALSLVVVASARLGSVGTTDHSNIQLTKNHNEHSPVVDGSTTATVDRVFRIERLTDAAPNFIRRVATSQTDPSVFVAQTTTTLTYRIPDDDILLAAVAEHDGTTGLIRIGDQLELTNSGLGMPDTAVESEDS